MRRRVAVAVAMVILVLGVIAAPAWAHHKAGHSNGGGNSSSNGKSEKSGWTEDNDTNDNDTPNNVPDGGDNAHPSGKDKSVEHGNSGNQGNSGSDPDDDGRGPDRSNGGPDKPSGSGGVDLADQDGNNGCGNDDDFEDDNEGWCGKPEAKDKTKPEPKAEPKEKPKKDDTPPAVSGSSKDDDPRDDVDRDAPEVLGSTLSRGPSADADADVVAGETLERAATGPASDGGVLPFTGASLIGFLIAGAALVLTGLYLYKVRLTN